MLIEFKGLSAMWDEAENSWASSDAEFERILDATIPQSVFAVDTPFREGGSSAIALEAARDALGSDLKVIRQPEHTAPAEEKDTDF